MLNHEVNTLGNESLTAYAKGKFRKKPTGRFEVYQATNETRSQRWYWRLRAPNGKILAVGGEGFSTRAKCINCTRRIAKVASFARLFILGMNDPSDA